MTWRNSFAYSDPFSRNHCVVNAYNHIRQGNAEDAQALATEMRQRGILSARGSVKRHFYREMVDLIGHEIVERWRPGPELFKLELVTFWDGGTTHRRQYYGPTVAAFVREHPTGSWILYVRSHAVALIDGVLRGEWEPRSRVRLALRLRPKATD